jgi:4-hydroxybenzoyl-CoA thioesterase
MRYERPVRFEEVDAAGIVFFARFLNYGHEALEAFFAPLDGGYVSLVMNRRIGVPAVHVECDFRSPLRYGDTANIDVAVTHVGQRSFTLRYTFTRAADDKHVATVTHVVATTDLNAMRAVAIPADVRALLEKNVATSAVGTK